MRIVDSNNNVNTHGAASQQVSGSRIKSGKQRPNLATLERISRTFDVPMASFGVTDSPTLPAALVQRAAQDALEALRAGQEDRARKILERLATALVESDL